MDTTTIRTMQREVEAMRQRVNMMTATVFDAGRAEANLSRLESCGSRQKVKYEPGNGSALGGSGLGFGLTGANDSGIGALMSFSALMSVLSTKPDTETSCCSHHVWILA